MTQPIFDPPTPMPQALDVMDSLLASPSVRLLHPGPRHWPLLRDTIDESRTRGGLVTDGGLAVGEVLAWLGVSGSVSKRARTIMATLDLGDPDTFAYQPVLGTSRYLTGQRRQRLVERREGLRTRS